MASLLSKRDDRTAEERIRELEEKVAELSSRQQDNWLLFNASPHPMWVFDRDTLVFLVVNEAAIRTYGYSREEFASLRVTDVRPESEVPKLLADLQRPEGTPGPWIHKRKDGSTFEVELRAGPVEFQGRPARLSVITDLTEVNQIQAALRQTQEHLQSFIQQATDSIFVADITGTFSFVNHSACELLAYSAEELVGKTIFDLIRPSEVRRLVRIRASLLAGNTEIGEWDLKRKDGSWVPVELSTKMLSGGRWQAFARDISERRRVEEKIRENNERLRIAVDTGHLGTWELDFANGTFTCSPRCKANFGVPADQEFSYSYLLSAIHPDDLPSMQEAVRCAIDHRVDYRAEYRLFWPDKSVHWVVASGRAMYSEDGLPLRMVGVTMDVTERRLAQQALEEQAAALERSNADLQQFAYATSHDLQEPLRMMSAYAQVLSRRYTGQLDQDATEFLNFIVSGASRMKNLIDALLNYSRVVNVESQPNSPVPLQSALQWAIKNLQIVIEDSCAVITHDELPTVKGAHVQLVQLFQNLLGNAIKYHGGTTPRIHVSARRDRQSWVVGVSDNGIGIPEDQRERIFGVFKRLHGPEIPGTGIGLAICKRIVEKHGGLIWVESAPGQGSTFFFSFPDVTPTIPAAE